MQYLRCNSSEDILSKKLIHYHGPRIRRCTLYYGKRKTKKTKQSEKQKTATGKTKTKTKNKTWIIPKTHAITVLKPQCSIALSIMSSSFRLIALGIPILGTNLPLERWTSCINGITSLNRISLEAVGESFNCGITQ